MSGFSLVHFNWADYVIVGIILLSIVISLLRGFVREAISLVTWIAAVWVGIRFSPALAALFENHIHTPSLRLTISFAILFIGVLIVGGLINFIIGQFIDKTGLNGTDRLLGAIFGLGRGILVVALIILMAQFTVLSKDPWWAKSQMIPQFHGLVAWIQNFLPEQFQHMTWLNQQTTTAATQITSVN